MRIVLAYSGDLTTTAAIPWLRQQYHADVITTTIDLGQGRALEAVRDRALAAGALRAHVLDGRDQFARDHILPSLKADALHQQQFVMAVPLGRPLIARKLVEIAEIERADAVAHGAPAQPGRPTPLEVLIRSVNPSFRVIAVHAPPPADRLADAGARTLGLPAGQHVEANLWGRSVRCAEHESAPPDEGVYTLTRDPAECPDEPAVVEIAFDRGIPRAINGVFMPLLELIASLGTIAGAHGVGRAAADGRLCEAPAAIVLHAAHRQLQGQATGGDLQAFARAVSLKYVDLICDGLWFTPLREALDAFVDNVQERVSGGVRLRLFKGNVVQHR
ncbi:MAG: argininosuccinate synthase [Luteitalea sp.]|nr:argininosuccinate synthase [Luteitalea sp.]